MWRRYSTSQPQLPHFPLDGLPILPVPFSFSEPALRCSKIWTLRRKNGYLIVELTAENTDFLMGKVNTLTLSPAPQSSPAPRAFQDTHCNLKPVPRGPVPAGASPAPLGRSSISPQRHRNMNSGPLVPIITPTVGSCSIGVAVGRERIKHSERSGMSSQRLSCTVTRTTTKTAQPLSRSWHFSLFQAGREMTRTVRGLRR